MTNTQFENDLRDACNRHLRPDLNVEVYVHKTLDGMWQGGTYLSGDGTEHYHEIPSSFTDDGNPVVVS